VRTLLAFVGPGLMVAVGYMDPGNWATDLAGGARFGYALLCVVLLSNLMAILLQHLALKLGVVAERDLAQACRDHFGPRANFVLWVLCEVAIAACDLAEVIGSAIALNLLFGIPLVWGVVITAADVLLILLLQARGWRLLEAVVAAMVLLIGACFAYEIVAARPDLPAVLRGLVPRTEVVVNPDMLYIAIGILGATVMPHNLYLHSAIVQTRDYPRTDEGKRLAVRLATFDSTAALLFAFFINAAILVLAAATFHQSGHQDVAGIEDAYALLTPAGQVVMEGFLDIRLPPWLRRLITRLIAIVPAVIVAALYGASGVNDLLILSQVILSLQLSFAVVPLVWFTSSRRKMGTFANTPILAGIAWTVTAVIVSLNCYLLLQVVLG